MGASDCWCRDSNNSRCCLTVDRTSSMIWSCSSHFSTSAVASTRFRVCLACKVAQKSDGIDASACGCFHQKCTTKCLRDGQHLHRRTFFRYFTAVSKFFSPVTTSRSISENTGSVLVWRHHFKPRCLRHMTALTRVQGMRV